MAEQFPDYIHSDYVQHLRSIGIVSPTDIQAKAMAPIMEGLDVIGVSKTGTGKTLAYLLPILTGIRMDIKAVQAIVLAPTHELAHQVYRVADALCKASASGVSAALCIGGASTARQLEALKLKPRLVVGSAGRILELHHMKKLSVHYVKTIVIDEADRLLDAQNIDGVQAVIKATLRDRQLLFFSATMDSSAVEKAHMLGKTPLHITAQTERALPETIEHMAFICEQREKTEVLRKVVHGAGIRKAIVFLNKQNDIEMTVKRLNYHQIKTEALFGGLEKHERQQVLRNFRAGKVTLLVASDLAARGLDIDDLTYIINLDMPENPTFYLHRAGRVGRMSQRGVAITIATKQEASYLNNIKKCYDIDIALKEMRFGHITPAR